MSAAAFTRFLEESLGAMAAHCRDGTIAFVCMDWRHMRELLDAGHAVFSELKNLCVWNKTNGGMGSFYRSKHELVFVWKVGEGTHVNSFGLGDTGRYRTNVWDYAGISSLSKSRAEELAMHPTVKPVALVAAIKQGKRNHPLLKELTLDGQEWAIDALTGKVRGRRIGASRTSGSYAPPRQTVREVAALPQGDHDHSKTCATGAAAKRPGSQRIPCSSKVMASRQPRAEGAHGEGTMRWPVLT